MKQALTEQGARPLAPGPVTPRGPIANRLQGYVKVLPKFLADPLGYLTQISRQYGGLVALSPNRIFFAAHPDHVKYVLQDHHVNYRKGSRYDVLRPLIGNGLFVSDGNFWRRQRRLAQPAFHRQHMAALADSTTQVIAQTLGRWHASTLQNTPLDVRGALSDLMVNILLAQHFGGGIGGETSRLIRAVTIMQDAVSLENSVNPLRFIPTPRQIRFRREKAYMSGFVQRMINQRRNGPANSSDLLSTLIFSKDAETGDAMDDRQLHDEVLTFLHAGTDPASSAVVWALYFLAQHPAIRSRVEQEIDTVLHGNPPSFENYNSLSYLQMVLQEIMRLYPPAWLFGREAIADDEIGGFPIPAGALVVLCPYVTHRSPELWEDPERFNPDRFQPENAHQRHRFAYFPFGGGPRMCIGSALAIFETTMVLAMAMQAFRLELVPGQSIAPTPRVTLRPNRPVWMTLEPRSKS